MYSTSIYGLVYGVIIESKMGNVCCFLPLSSLNSDSFLPCTILPASAILSISERSVFLFLSYCEVSVYFGYYSITCRTKNNLSQYGDICHCLYYCLHSFLSEEGDLVCSWDAVGFHNCHFIILAPGNFTERQDVLSFVLRGLSLSSVER